MIGKKNLSKTEKYNGLKEGQWSSTSGQTKELFGDMSEVDGKIYSFIRLQSDGRGNHSFTNGRKKLSGMETQNGFKANQELYMYG